MFAEMGESLASCLNRFLLHPILAGKENLGQNKVQPGLRLVYPYFFPVVLFVSPTITDGLC